MQSLPATVIFRQVFPWETKPEMRCKPLSFMAVLLVTTPCRWAICECNWQKVPCPVFQLLMSRYCAYMRWTVILQFLPLRTLIGRAGTVTTRFCNLALPDVSFQWQFFPITN